MGAGGGGGGGDIQEKDTRGGGEVKEEEARTGGDESTTKHGMSPFNEDRTGRVRERGRRLRSKHGTLGGTDD